MRRGGHRVRLNGTEDADEEGRIVGMVSVCK